MVTNEKILKGRAHLVAFCFAATCAMSAVLAETVVVDDVTSLTNALDRLNRLSSAQNKDLGHIVRLAPGSYDVSGCHMLCDVANPDYDFTQSRSHLAISRVTLTGTTDNPRDTVVYGDGTERIFYAYGGKLQNLTISNGCVNASSSVQAPVANKGGGGIACRNESTYLVNCVVTDCRAPEGDGGGAAVLCEARDCLFIGNVAKYGGAMANCRKGEYSNPYGGVTNCTFICNAATVSGGATENCPIESALMVSNRCEKFGGAVFNNAAGGNYFLRNAVIMHNYAHAGGGGVYQVSTGGVVSNCLIACNSSDSAGGGLYMSLTAGTCAYDTVISNNVCAGIYDTVTWAGGAAGVIYGSLVNCRILDNAVTGIVASTSSCLGGGVREVTATNCLIAGNYASYAGGGAVRSTLVDCIVSNNHAQCLGGGVYGIGIGGASPMVVFGGKVTANWVENRRTESEANFRKNDGGGCYLATVSNAVVIGNAVVDTGRGDRNGGGGFGSEFFDCEIAYNFSQVGGAVHKGRLTRCRVRDNATPIGMYLIADVTDVEACDIVGQAFCRCARIVNSRIHDFDARAYATIPEGVNAHTGGTFAVSGELALFSNANLAAPNQFAMTNCLVCDNYLSHMFSGSNRGNDSMVNCSVINNNWDWQLYNLTADTANLELVNSIFQGNMNRAGTAKRNFWPDSADQHITISHCIFEGKADTGNTVADGIRYWKSDAVQTRTETTVRFDAKADPAWPYQPDHVSASYARGLVQDWMATALDVRDDVRYPRLRDDRVDIGCYQNWHVPAGTVLILR